MGIERAAAAYGLFMIGWSSLEILIEVAIMRELTIEARKAAIVTSGMAFKARVSVLQSLLALRGSDSKAAISLLNEISAIAKRNILVHGHVHSVDNDGLCFVKADASHTFRARKATFTPVELLKHVKALTTRTTTLQKMLSISNEDLQQFANVSLSLAATERPGAL